MREIRFTGPDKVRRGIGRQLFELIIESQKLIVLSQQEGVAGLNREKTR